MTDWTASNGIRITVDSDGYVLAKRDEFTEGTASAAGAAAFREFFIAGADLPILPSEPGSIICWDDGAYVKHTAYLCDRPSLGWRTDSSVKRDGSGNEQVWATPEEVALAIGVHGFQVLVPLTMDSETK